MDYLALSDFNLVARHGGFGKASRASGRSKATLSRRVAVLEASLGIRLMQRSPRSLRLTEEGRILFERIDPLIKQFDEVAETLASSNVHPRGLLRVSSNVLVAQTMMGHLAAIFVQRFPFVRLEVVAEDRTVNVVEEGYDLVLRINPRPDSELTGRCFLRDRMVCVASPTMRRPDGGEPVQAVIMSLAPLSPSWTILDNGKRLTMRPEPVLSLSSVAMVRDAALAGSGAACVCMSVVARYVAAGQLVIWGDVEAGAVELWVLYGNRRPPSAKVTAFLTLLADVFPEGKLEELAALLDGKVTR